MNLSGLVYPQNDTELFQENFLFEQESKENEIINRNTDLFDAGIVKGGVISINANPNSIDLTEITIAYDYNGKRIVVPALVGVTLPANSSFTLVACHKFVDEVVATPSGFSTYKKNSYEILFRTGSIQAGDVPIRSITTTSGVVSLGEDLRVWRHIKTDKIADESITLAKQNSAVKTGLLTDISNTILSEVTGDLSFAKAINQLYLQRKELGEVFFLNELKAGSPDFPAICLSRDNATIWKSGNPLGAGNIPGNFSEFVDYLRAIPLRFDPLNANNIDFTVSSWSYSGATITLTFAYTTPKGTKESKLVRSLHEDAFVHNSNDSVGVVYSDFANVTSWRTITLVEPLRNDTDVIQVPVGTYQITSIAGGESGASQIKFVHSGTPSGTPKSESRLMRFYPYRIQDAGQNLDVNAGIKALHYAVQGRGFVTVMDADSEWVGGLRRRDRGQGFGLPSEMQQSWQNHANQSRLTFGDGATLTSYLAGLVNDGVNGTPRIGNTNDPRGLGLYPYIWAKSFS